MGAHHTDSSSVMISGRQYSLLEVIQDKPKYWLGSDIQKAYNGQLPFLLKLLAADHALSIQVHPSVQQAARGYALEERQGIAAEAPFRTYKDANHKPEMLLAQSDFWGMCGFRPGKQIARLFLPARQRLETEQIDSAELEELWCILDSIQENGGLERFFRAVMSLILHNRLQAARLLSAVLNSSYEELVSIDSDVAYWVQQLSEQFPADPAAIAPLFLNLIHLQPGEAIALHAGVLHAYLSGLGIEIMANSDNVIRAGLTHKHVDAEALIDSVQCVPYVPAMLRPEWDTPSTGVFPHMFKEFSLLQLKPDHGKVVFDRSSRIASSGPRILLAGADARLQIHDSDGNWLEVISGNSVVIPHAVETFSVTGSGEGFVAAVGSGRCGET